MSMLRHGGFLSHGGFPSPCLFQYESGLITSTPLPKAARPTAAPHPPHLASGGHLNAQPGIGILQASEGEHGHFAGLGWTVRPWMDGMDGMVWWDRMGWYGMVWWMDGWMDVCFCHEIEGAKGAMNESTRFKHIDLGNKTRQEAILKDISEQPTTYGSPWKITILHRYQLSMAIFHS